MRWPSWFAERLDDAHAGAPFRPLYVELTADQMDAIDLDMWITLGGWHEHLHDSAPGGAIAALGKKPGESVKIDVRPLWHHITDPAGDLLIGRVSWFVLRKLDRDPDLP